MITFDDQTDMVTEEIGIADTATLLKVKRDLNRGGSRFINCLGREYNRKSRFTNIEADKQYYQTPEDTNRIKLVVATSGGSKIPLSLVADEEAWRLLNMTNSTGQPTHFFIRGHDEIGLYPIPSADVSAGLEIVFGPRSAYLRAADVTGSTAVVTNGSSTVTASDTPFTAAMVGRGFEITDETDSRWYRISGFNSTSSIELENYYQGTSGTVKPFRIGEVMDIPEEFLEGPVSFAIWRHWKRRGAKEDAAIAKGDFEETLQQTREQYGQQTDSQIVMASEATMNRAYNSFRGDSQII